MTIQSIALVGDFSPGSLESSYKRAFEAIGLRTHCLDLIESKYRLGWFLRNRVGHRLTVRGNVVRELASRTFNRHLESDVLLSKAPALIIFKGPFVMPETLRRIRSKGIRVACYYPDNPFPPHVCNRPETLPAARETDLYLIWSEPLVKKLGEAGVRNPAFLPFAWDPEVFPYLESQPQGRWPGVLFLGGWDKEREEFLEKLACHVPLRIFGPGSWRTKTKAGGRVRQCWQGSDLRLAAAARVVRDSAISINLLRTQHIIDGKPDGLIMRHFEVPGAGGFLLSTRGGGATTFFPEGETGSYFSDLAECVEKAKSYIENDAARRKLAERAHSEVASNHQYTHRAQQILRLLSECW